MTDRGSARRRVAGRTAIVFGAGCAVAALAVLAYAGWELWGTGGAERALQAELREAYADVAETAADQPAEVAPATSATPAAGDGPEPVAEAVSTLPGGVTPDVAALQFPSDGPALARLEIPAIELDKFVMRDVSVPALQVGPGHYERTPRPGFTGNAAIAGHRTTYGAPFGRVDELAVGDEITVYSADGRFTYRVMAPEDAFGDRITDIDEIDGAHVVVDPKDTWVVSDFGDARLTLTSCHPEFTSRDRIVVVAELVSEGIPRPDVFGGLSQDQLLELVSEDLSVLDEAVS